MALPFRTIARWFFSRRVRRAFELRQRVRRLANEQRDLLSAETFNAIDQRIAQTSLALKDPTRCGVLEERMADLVSVAEDSLKGYPHAIIRENVKEIFVAATIILAFTTFFLQLTKIPTGSMQPTLFGITYRNLRDHPEVPVPGLMRRFFDYWIDGVAYYHIVAKADGILELKNIGPPQTIFPFIKRQKIRVGDLSYSVWPTPDQLVQRAGLYEGQFFRKGDDIIRLQVTSGDHLLMDRLTYNFRRPRRGEIIVFKTKGIARLPQDQLYIKRLVGLGGETVSIGDDRHLLIDAKRLDAATPHFENVYTFDSEPREDRYSGHLNQRVANEYGLGLMSRLFRNKNDAYTVPPHHYLTMGDNTTRSYDSRDWGSFPDGNVIGRCWFVYWPFTKRFGWGNR